jgi:hypothetical protein
MVAMIKSKTHDFSVTFEYHGEHHMGAETVYMMASRPIGGVTRFHTTNGNAFFTPDGNGLFLHDSCVILYFDIASGSVFNFAPPQGWYFGGARTQGAFLTFDLYDGAGHFPSGEPILLSEVTSKFDAGFGAVVDGKFPSAWPR